jgi:hypothetical protein
MSGLSHGSVLLFNLICRAVHHSFNFLAGTAWSLLSLFPRYQLPGLASRCHREENEPRHLCLPTDGSTSTSAFVPPSLTPVHTVHVEDRRSHSSGPIFPPTVPRKLKQQERPIHQSCGLFTRTERKECAENEQGYTGIGAIDDSLVPGWGLGLTSRAEHRCCGSQEFVSLRFHPSNPRVVVQ